MSKVTKLYSLLPLFFAILFSANVFMAHAANTEVFLIPFEIGGMFFLGIGQYLIAGLLLGTGFLIRQTGIFTFISGFIFIIIILKKIDKQSYKQLLKNLLTFILAFITPFILLTLYFAYLKVLDKFIYYSFINPLQNLSRYLVDIRRQDLILTRKLLWLKFTPELFIFSILSSTGLILSLISKNKVRIMIATWFIVMGLWMLKGAIYTHHYLQMVAPVACLSLLGLTDIFEFIKKIFKTKIYLKNICITIIIVILLIPFMRLAVFYITGEKAFFTNYGIEDRFLAAQYIKEHTSQNDRIFVWDHLDAGAIYLWSGRENVTRFAEKNSFLPVYLQDHWVLDAKDYLLNQKQLISDLNKGCPKHIVIVMDYEKIIWMHKLIKSRFATYGDWRLAVEKSLVAEEKVFPELFNLLAEKYKLENEFGICKIYRFIK